MQQSSTTQSTASTFNKNAKDMFGPDSDYFNRSSNYEDDLYDFENIKTTSMEHKGANNSDEEEEDGNFSSFFC